MFNIFAIINSFVVTRQVGAIFSLLTILVHLPMLQQISWLLRSTIIQIADLKSYFKAMWFLQLLWGMFILFILWL